MAASKNKVLYQPWNEDAFRSSWQVQALSPPQRWMYRTLLQAAFQHTTRPDLPADDAWLWLLSGCESIKQWRDNKKPILALFEKDGKILFQQRLRDDWERVEVARDKHKETSRRGGLATAHKHRTGGAPAVHQVIEVREVREVREEKKEEADSDFPSISSQPREEEWEMSSAFKQFTSRCVEAWKEVKGRSAQIRPPQQESKKEWEFLLTNYDHALLIDAFKLWAQEEGSAADPWALSKFVRSAGKYMQRIEPTKDDIKKASDEKAINENIEKQIAENIAEKKKVLVANEASLEELL